MTSMTQRPQVEAVMEALPPLTRNLPTGGNDKARGFKAEAVATSQPTAPAEETTVTEQRAQALNRTTEYISNNPDTVTTEQATALLEVAGSAEQTEGLQAAGRTLTAQVRATFPRVVIATEALPAGSVAIHRDLDDNVHAITFDPEQTTRDQVEAYINISIAGTGGYVEYTDQVYRALRPFNLPKLRADDPRPEVVEFWDTVEQAVIAANDPAAAVRVISEQISQTCTQRPDAEPPKTTDAK